MYFSTWYKFICQKCQSTNWIDGGDTSDITGYDPQGCICYQCGNIIPFDGYEKDDVDENDVGVKNPN